jgi:hypothetical protein
MDFLVHVEEQQVKGCGTPATALLALKVLVTI